MISRQKRISFICKHCIFILSTAFLPCFLGCGQQPAELRDYQPDFVLTAFVENSRPFERVLVERVSPLDVEYHTNDYGIRDAVVLAIRIDSDSLRDSCRFIQHPSPDSSGVYIPLDTPLIPETGDLFHVQAVISNNTVWGESLVPGILPGVRWLVWNPEMSRIDSLPFDSIGEKHSRARIPS